MNDHLEILMPIKPIYAERIFRGEKGYEFRRRIFKRRVDKVLVYESSPVKKIVGEFEVSGVLADAPDKLWYKCSARAGIDQSDFTAYFSGVDKGYAICIGKVKRYAIPVPISSICDHVPQSYCYVQRDLDVGATRPK